MKREKALGYWPTRIMLAVAVLAVGLELLLIAIGLELLVIPAFPWPGWMEPMFDSRVAPVGVTQLVALDAACAGMSLAGLARMVRVYRGPRDEPPAWRHRDR